MATSCGAPWLVFAEHFGALVIAVSLGGVLGGSARERGWREGLVLSRPASRTLDPHPFSRALLVSLGEGL